MSQDENGPLTDEEKQRIKDVEARNTLLRILRTEIQDLTGLLERIKAGQLNTVDSAEYIRKTGTDVEELLQEISQNPAAQRSDTVRHITNIWEQMRGNPLIMSPDTARETQDELHDLTMLIELSADIVLAIGHLTIPGRVNAWLTKARPGYYLPFHLLFEDELPSLAGRVRVLNAIAAAPDALQNGIVSAATGLIYRYEKEKSARLFSVLTVLLFLLATTASIPLLAHIGKWLAIASWPLPTDKIGDLTVYWWAVLLGTVTHIGIASVKRSQASGLPPVMAINDWQLYVSARKGDIMLKIFIALFGFFGLVFSVGADKVTPVDAFLIGYSLDSVVELFGTSIEQRAAAQVSALKEQLGITRKDTTT